MSENLKTLSDEALQRYASVCRNYQRRIEKRMREQQETLWNNPASSLMLSNTCEDARAKYKSARREIVRRIAVKVRYSR